MPSRGESLRLFFALWPSEELRQAIRTQLNRWRLKGGRRVKPENLHITLAFLGSVPRERIDCLLQSAAQVNVPPFELCLDRFGHFRRNGLLWLGSGQWPETLFELQQHLNEAVAGCELPYDSKPYRPHLTLVRKLRTTPRLPPMQPLSWPVERFVLVSSETLPEGAKYRILGEWKLG